MPLLLETPAQGAPVHREQIGDVVGRAVIARQPRAQQPPNVVGEFGALRALQLLDLLLQHRPQQRIGPGNPQIQIAGREDDGGAFLVEPHRGSEMVPIQRLIRWGGPGQQNLTPASSPIRIRSAGC